MSALIRPKTITVDGLSVRYAEGGQDGPAAILKTPWPERRIRLRAGLAAPRGRRAPGRHRSPRLRRDPTTAKR
jgi:hypothetical protein